MIKRIIIILVIVLKLLPGQQKYDSVQAQYGIEFEFGYWQEIDFSYSYGPPVYEWVALGWITFEFGYSNTNQQEADEWAAYLNEYAQTAYNENEAWAAQFQDTGGYVDWSAQDWYDYLESIYTENNPYNPGSNPPPEDSMYFITTDGGNAKYYKNDTIYLPQRIGKTAKLSLHKGTGIVPTTNLAWKKDDTTKCTSAFFCSFDVSNIDTFNLKIDSSNNIVRMTNVVKIYKQPTFYFNRGDNYSGEYGFDDYDSTFKNPYIKATYATGYEMKHISQDTAYKVPWMSLLDSQTVGLKPTLLGLSTDAKKDKNAKVRFGTSTPNILAFYPSPTWYDNRPYEEILTGQFVNIYATQWDGQTDDHLKSIGSVFAVTNTNDTIGKLNLSCSKPSERKIVFVYVNTGSGYDSIRLSKTDLLNNLNTKSHNQVMRKWVLDNSYSDTMDLSTEYAADPTKFIYDSMPDVFRNYYKTRTGIDPDTLNNGVGISSKVHFFFITKLTFTTPTIRYGITWEGGSYGTLFGNAGVITSNHEHGHILNIMHTFEPPYNITRNSTSNIMDSRSVSTDTRNWFGYFQWKIVN